MKGTGSKGPFPPAGQAPKRTAVIVPPKSSKLPSPLGPDMQHDSLWSVYTGDVPPVLLGYAESEAEARAIAEAYCQPT